jgi:hypothetical protein
MKYAVGKCLAWGRNYDGTFGIIVNKDAPVA